MELEPGDIIFFHFEEGSKGLILSVDPLEEEVEVYQITATRLSGANTVDSHCIQALFKQPNFEQLVTKWNKK